MNNTKTLSNACLDLASEKAAALGTRSDQKRNQLSPLLSVKRMPTLRAISLAYPCPARPSRHGPFNGYDVAGALLCFCHNLPGSEAPIWMRFPTAGDVRECLVHLGLDCAAAKDAALRLCELCDEATVDRAWNFLAELLGRTVNLSSTTTLPS